MTKQKKSRAPEETETRRQAKREIQIAHQGIDQMIGKIIDLITNYLVQAFSHHEEFYLYMCGMFNNDETENDEVGIENDIYPRYDSPEENDESEVCGNTLHTRSASNVLDVEFEEVKEEEDRGLDWEEECQDLSRLLDLDEGDTKEYLFKRYQKALKARRG